MRKLVLSLMSFVLMATAVSAQSTANFGTMQAGNGVIQKNQGAFTAMPKKVKQTPAKITLPENQMIMGNYTSDNCATSQEGLGLPGYPGNLRVATIIPCEAGSKFDGGTVKSIRFALANATPVSAVFMIELTTEGRLGNEVVNQAISADAVAGWNTVELETPYTINAEGLQGYLVGFDYTQSNANDGQYYNVECYPLSLVNEGKEVVETDVYGNLGQGLGWYNIGAESYGNLSVQCIVENDHFPEYDLSVSNVDVTPYAKVETEVGVYGTISNEGTKMPESYTIGIALDDNEIKEISSEALTMQDGVVELESTITVPGDATKGSHNVSVYVKTINGAIPTECTEDDKDSAAFAVFNESLPRQKQLVEQFTSQYCTHCPKGIAVLEGLAEQRGDIAWVAIHQNFNSTDVFRIAKGDNIASALGVSGLPSAAFNRTLIPGEDGIAAGIGFDASYKQQAIDYFSDVLDYSNLAPTMASINIATAYNKETNKLDITVSGQVMDDFNEVIGGVPALTVFLTEDGLIARQYNSGKWVNSFEHNDVLRSIPGSAYGDVLTVSDGTYEKTYSVSINSAWNIDNMNVVACIGKQLKSSASQNTFVTVNNAEKIKAYDKPNAINDVATSTAGTKEVARYSVNGIRLSAPVKGINIVRMSDGTVKKVIVE